MTAGVLGRRARVVRRRARAWRRKAWAVVAVAVAAAAAVAVALPGAVASAAAPGGQWAGFGRCPVTDASMLAADGRSVLDECIDSASPGGTITLGSTTVPLGASDLQVGALINATVLPHTDSSVDPAGGAVVAAPAQIPGGLIGLICPSSVPVITALCSSITNNTLNAVTATLQPAGTTSGLDINAAISQGEPVLTIPVKIQLSNPILGSSCYIGSDSDPIVLTIENSVAPTGGATTRFDADGTPDTTGLFQDVTSTGGTQSDSDFAVPGASGCDGILSPLVDAAVDLRAGLPAASGNSLTLNDPVLSFAGYALSAKQAPSEGQNLAAAFASSES